MSLDNAFVRQQFDSLEKHGDFIMCGNAGGSFIANQVNTQLEHYNHTHRVQPYYPYSLSHDAGLAMDAARQAWADAINCDIREITFGASTSINTYVMAQAIGDNLQAGDEIIVTNQDHESNSGVWRRMAEAKGVTVREWKIDPELGLLHADNLVALLNENTRWIFFTHCSNVIGTINPVVELVQTIRQYSGAKVAVDAVAYAPHHIADVKQLDVDLYFFSLYKIFGPHQGIFYLRDSIAETLKKQCHYFLAEDTHKRFNPTGPQHAQVAASKGVLDYFSTLYQHHFQNDDSSIRHQLDILTPLIVHHETTIIKPLVDFLANHKATRLLGAQTCDNGDRAATLAFQPLSQEPLALAQKLHKDNVGAEHGHYYGVRALEGVGINPEQGVVRLSLVHYNNAEEVSRIIQSLEKAL